MSAIFIFSFYDTDSSFYVLASWPFTAWFCRYITLDKTGIQGPVVQSVVSLTSSLRVIPLTVLADSIYNILIFFAEKM